MKLIICKKCNDVVRLVHTKWRKCECGESGGQYNDDLQSATVGGNCEVIGIRNDWVSAGKQKRRESGLNTIIQGEYLGDVQIHRIISSDGPKLNMEITELDKDFNEITFKDRRKYTINVKGSDKSPKTVKIEKNTKGPSFKSKTNENYMKDKIRQMVREGLEDKITKISIFDFDGTLIDTPEPETGRVIYKEKTGNDWPFKGWWGRNEGLDMEVFDIQPIQKVVSDYNEEKARPNTKVVMMTGRIPKNAPFVEKILNTYNLTFDAYIYKKASDTLAFKIGKLEEMIAENPNLREIEMWEDRPEHTAAFREWGNNKEVDVVVNQV